MKKKILNYSVALGMTLGVFSVAPLLVHAAPSAFEAKRCGPLEITNTTSSTVVRDHEDCSKVWVMPPDMGIATTKHFKRSGNLGFCAEMKDLQAGSRKISKKIASLTLKIDEQTPQILRAQRKVELAKKNLARFASSDAIKTFRELSNQKEDNETRLAEIEDKLDVCISSCNALEANYKDLRAEKQKLNFELRNLRRLNRIQITNFERAKAQVEGAQENLDYLSDFVLNIVDRQRKLHRIVLDIYKDYAKIEGGSVTIDHDLLWNQNLSELEKKYNEYNFSKVPTKEARLNANFIGANDKDSYLDTLPVLLDYSIAGFKYLPYGEQSTSDIVSVPNNIQGDLRLSLIGGCPYYYKNFLDERSSSDSLEADSSLNQKEYSYGLSMSYLYPVVYRFNLEAKYNLYKFYKKVVESGSSGGLFSSRSWKNVTETKIDIDTFEITWLDEGELYTREEKEQIRKTIKTELAGRALQNMGQRAGSATGPLVAINSYTPQPGALVLAEGLAKTCGWNIYCQGGSWILKGLSSIFGGSSAEASFQSTHDSTSIEKWNQENVMWRAGASSFTEK